MSKTREKCGDEFFPEGSDDPAFTCDRDVGLHIVHRDSSTGTTAVRIPGGAWVTSKKG